MQLNVIKGALQEAECDVLIVNLFDGVKTPSGGTGTVDKALDGLISKEIIEKDDFKAKLGKITALRTYGKIPASKVLILGLGKREKFGLNEARKAAANAAKACRSLKATKVCSILHGAGIADLPVDKCAEVLAEGTLLSLYKFNKYKSKNDYENANGEENGNGEDNDKNEIQEFTIVEIDESKINDIEKGLKQGKIIAEATNFARGLIFEQPSVMTPTKLSEEALSLGLDCKVFEQDQIEQMGMGSFLGVAKGSSQPPKFIQIKYIPEGTPKKKIAIVGKGITFDSGGLNLKPASGMIDMKSDMAGAAATLGIMKAVKELKPEIEIIALIPTCENMPDGKSYKPGDVLTAKNGKTIEVNNTDAEGRLILADALCYAVEENPDEIIDIATLTGAVVIALGDFCAGIMGNDQNMINDFLEKAEDSGERLWQLPLYEDLIEGLKSDIADISNISSSRGAGSSVAGKFLEQFVNKVTWLHIDIAGAARLSKGSFENPKGYTGFAVRSILYYIINH